MKCSFSLAFSEIPAGCVCCLCNASPPGASSTCPETSLRISRSLSQPSALTTKPSQHPEPFPQLSPQSRHSSSGVTSGGLRRGEGSPPSVCSLPSWPSETPEMPPALVGHQELALVPKISASLPQMQNYFSSCFSPEQSNGQKCTESSQETRTNSSSCLSLPCCSHPISQPPLLLTPHFLEVLGIAKK